MITYGVSITVKGMTYNFHIPNAQGVRELFAGVTEQIDDFTIYEEKGADMREMTFTEIARLLEPNYSLVA